MITIIGAEKALDKIQHSFMMKTLSNLGIERNNLIKNIYKKKTPTANIIINGVMLEIFLLRSETRKG